MSINSKLTLADVKAIVGRYCSSTANQTADINQVMSRYWDKGIFKDMLFRYVFQTGAGDTGMIALPRQCLSLVGIDFNGYPAPVYNQTHQYQELGFGYMDPQQYSMRGVVDLGDSHPTYRSIASISTTAGKLRFTIDSAADAGKTVRLFGTSDTAGTRIYDSSGVLGEQLTTVSPFNDTVRSYCDVTDIQIASGFVGYSHLSYIAADGTVTEIADFEPGDVRPSFRWYATGVSDTAIQVLTRERFIPYANETDWVKPPNIGAIKLGLQALTQEDAMQKEKSMALWAEGEQLFNDQLEAMRGNIQPRFTFTGGKTTLGTPMQLR
jgi:hypothetical protein